MEPTIKATFPVQGMSCAACATSIESILQNTQGVKNVSVNYANQTALVEYSSNVTTDFLRKSVQSIGYDLLIEVGDKLQDAADKRHLEQLEIVKKRTIGAGIFTIPVVIIGMFFMNIPFANYIMLILTTPVVFVFGRHFFASALLKVRHKQANMDTLVAVSTGVAYFFSLFNTLYPEFWHNKGLHPHVYFEAAAVVITFISLGKWLEERAKSSTSAALRKLVGLQVKTVRVLRENGQEEELDISDVKVNDVILVKSGEKIPVDGVVTSGESFVDESSITGESIPTLKTKDAKVFAGTINQQGVFQFQAQKIGRDTILGQIIKVVQEAQGSKAPVQRLVDKISGVFVPIVLIISLITFVLWMTFGDKNAFPHALMSAITVLVIACPCALGLATPTAIMVGIGKGAENNILIKDAESLEVAQKVNAIILDKTGTITEGKPQVIETYWKKEDLINKQILYSLVTLSTHPLSQAIASHLDSNTSNFNFNAFENIPGKGIKAEYKGEVYLLGNRRLIIEFDVHLDKTVDAKVQSWVQKAFTMVYFTRGQELLALMAIADKIKENSSSAIEQLKQAGIDIYMLTGDNEATAKAVAQQTGINHFRSEVLPAEKASFTKELQHRGKIVAMVGDGINDSQALAQADISIAMAKGADIAIDVAKITLLTSSLTAIPKALKLSKLTVNTIKQNLFWAFIYNLIGIPVAAGLLYPFNGFLLNPMIAGAAMALSSVSVVVSSLRLKYIRLD